MVTIRAGVTNVVGNHIQGETEYIAEDAQIENYQFLVNSTRSYEGSSCHLSNC